MSADMDGIFKDLEKNSDGKSILDDELVKAKLDSMSEAEINNLLESLRQIGIEHQKYQEAHKEEIEREMQAAKAKIAAYDFEDFYISCYREANDLAEKNPFYAFTYNNGQSCVYNINHWLEYCNKIDDFIVKEIAPKLHTYIREHGIPAFFPKYVKYYQKLTFNPDSSNPFQTNEICVDFFFCAPYHPTMPNGNFAYYFSGKARDRITLKAQLIKPTYEPNWRNDYDEEFSRLCAEADALDKQIQNIEDELARAEDDLKSYRVNQLTDIFDFAFLNSCRKEARKDIANAKQKIQTLIPDLKKQWEDIYNSEAYDAARRRNEEAYETDCRLAAEWQSKWYEECKTKCRECFF